MLKGPVVLAPKALQYVDDTIILAEVHPKNLQVIVEVLKNFTKLKGLHINDHKSAFVSISLPPLAISMVRNILGCDQKKFPITYLGLPLSIKKLRKMNFLPLIQAAQVRLQGWQSKYLLLAGRLVVVKLVLSALAIHYKQVLKLLKWYYGHLDRLRRSFLWKGKENCSGSQCLVNWDKCYMPKHNDGLGVLHLSTQNDTLLIKWLWKLRIKPSSEWTNTVRELYGMADI